VNRPTAVVDSDVASEPDNAVIQYSAATLQVARRIGPIPSPQDFARCWDCPFLGGPNQHLATTKDGRLVLVVQPIDNPSASQVSTVSGATGAAAVTTLSWSSRGNPEVALVTSPDTDTLYFIRRGPGTPSLPTEFSVSNGASFNPDSVASGSLTSTFSSTGVSQNFYATSLPLPRQLGGVSLRVGGTLNFDSGTARWNYSPVGSVEAPLHFVGPSQINFQIPPGLNLGDSVPAQITKPDGTTLLSTARITATAPGIFTVLMNGQGQAAALNQDNSQNGNPQSILGARPAARGSVIQIFATGAGETDPPLLPGEAASITGNPLVLTRAQPTVTIGGQAARVLFSGMAPGWVGLWQINAEIPASVTPGSAVPLSITAGGVSSNTVTIAVE
jgi:uncharacterized protein (TIGR03437 family)